MNIFSCNKITMTKKEKSCTTIDKKKTTTKKLSEPLDLLEFYCLTCKKKRQLKGISDITISTAKNGRKIAKAKCSCDTCTRLLTKFLSNDQASQLSQLTKRRKAH